LRVGLDSIFEAILIISRFFSGQCPLAWTKSYPQKKA